MTNTMKHSGIPWIGDIPSHWEVDAIGNLYSERKDKVSDKEYAPLSVTKNGVLPQLETAAKTDNGDDRKLVKVGDFAINSRSDRRGSCGISQYDGSVSLINTILTPKTEMNPQFYDWLFHTTVFADEFYKWGHGIVDDLWTTRWQEMKHISIVVPPLSEQKAIADYLDKHCAEVDEMVSLQEKIIEELRAYRQAIITETVTRGLNPNAPMKDSGVEWIGQIPEGWEIKRLKNLFALQTGTTPDNYEEQSDENVWWFTPSDVTEEGNVIIKSERVLSKKNIVEQKIALFPIGSLIFVGIGASAGKLGYAAIEGYSNQQITALIPKKNNICSKYFFYFMCADKKRLKDNAFYTTLPIISNSYLAQNLIISPTLSDQQAIADYLDKKTAEIDQLITIKQRKIEELKEYKKSLIYEYVTGKKEVDGE